MSETRRLTMQQALSQAEQAAKKGDIDFAKQLYAAVLQKHPDHLFAKKSLRKLEKNSQLKKTRLTVQADPSLHQMDNLISLFNSGEMSKAKQACKKLLAAFPQAATVYTVLGAILMRQGKAEQALKTYDQVILLKPDYADAYNNRGNVLKELGQFEEAIKSYDRAIQLKPDYAKACTNRGNTHKDLGQLEEAIKSYDRAVELEPDYAEAYNNRGTILQELGHLKDAIKSYDQAIQLKPDYAQAYYNRGIAFQELGQLEEAIKSYDRVIQLKPDFAKVYDSRGIALQDLKQLEEAIKSYDLAIRLQPDYAEAYYNRGNALKELGQLEEAIKGYDKAIELKLDYAQAYNNRGNAFKELGQFEKAVKNYDRAIQIKPDYVKANNNRGAALQELGQLEEAIKSYDQAIQLQPDSSEAYSNRGTALQDFGRLEEAIKSYAKAIQISPDFYSARYNRSLAWLSGGNFQQGWPEHEFRIQTFEDRKRTFHQGAEWQAEPLEDKLLFIYPEQGLGDTIQFLRYLPLIKKLGGKVIFEVPKPLERLIETFQGIDQLCTYEQNGDASSMNKFDYHVPLMSLPGLFNTTLETIPSTSPYLAVDNKFLRMWQTRIASKELFKVGIVWAGAGIHKKDHMRSILLSDFKVLSDIKGVKLFSLQKEKYAKWTDIDPGEVVDMDLGAEMLDFTDTAAIIENLDLVVSVDTSVVHLAGALGKEVWTLLPFSPDWRWMLNRSDSPWYPTMRLFRQPSVCDWKSVLQEVRKALVQRSALMGSKVVP